MLNIIEMHGETVNVATYAKPLFVTASGGTVTHNIQIAGTNATASRNRSGIAHYNDSIFTIDTDGFVSLIGNAPAILKLALDAGTTPIVPAAGIITLQGTTVAAGSTPVQTFGSGANTGQIRIQRSQAIAAEDTDKVGLCNFDQGDFTVTNGFVTLAGGGATQTLTPDFDFDGTAAIAISPQSGNINVLTYNPVSPNTFANSGLLTLNTNGAANGNLGIENRTWTTQYIVDPSSTVGSRGTYSTIDSAYTAAKTAIGAGATAATIFLRHGTYDEDITMDTAGINLCAYNCDGQSESASVVIQGKFTVTYSGSASISGCYLTGDTDNYISLTGGSASKLYLYNCSLNANGATGILQNRSSSYIFLQYCTFVIESSDAPFVVTSGNLYIINCSTLNWGGDPTATGAAGTLRIWNSLLQFIISTSGTIGLQMICSEIRGNNTTCLTIGGNTGNDFVKNSSLISGTAAAISVSAGATLTAQTVAIQSSNDNPITGAGIINYAGITYSSTSNVNTTTAATLNEGPSKTIGSANTGATNTLTVTNSSNTASSSAKIISTVGGGTASDPTYQAVVSGVTTWTWGIDNSVTTPFDDPFVLSQGTALGTNNVLVAQTTGEVTKPLQSAFLAVLDTGTSDVTGDGTSYTIIYDTEKFDQNSDYNLGTGTFTAPVTGKYQIECVVRLVNGTSINNTSYSSIVTSNNTFRTFTFLTTATRLMTSTSVLADMDAGDTFTVVVTATDSGGKIDDLGGSASGEFANFCSCFLAC